MPSQRFHSPCRLLNAFLLPALLMSATLLQAQPSSTAAYQLAVQAEALRGTQAVPLLDSARQICRTRTCADSTWAKIFHRLGVAYFQGYIDDDLAIAYTDSARRYYESYLGDDHPLVANQLYNQAMMEKAVGQTAAADQHMSAALNTIEDNETLSRNTRDSIRATWYTELADVKLKMNDPATGLGFAQKALTIAEQRWPQPVRLHATLPMLIGNEYFNSSDFASAFEFYERARERFEAIPGDQRVYIANVRNNIAVTLREMGREATALPELQAALKGYQAIEDPSNWVKINWANTLHNLCWYHTTQGNWSAALSHYQAAYDLLTEVYPNERYPEIGNLFLLRAKLEAARGRFDAAERYCQRALGILWPGRTREDAPIIGPLQFALEALDVQAQIWVKQDDTAAALEQYHLIDELVTQSRRRFQADWSKFLLTQRVTPAYEHAISLAHTLFRESGDPDFLEEAYRFSAVNKAVLLREGLQDQRAMAFSNIPTELLAQEEELRESITRQQTALYQAYQRGETTDSLSALLFSAQQSYADFVRQLETSYPAYYDLKYATHEPPSMMELQSALAPSQMLMEFFVGQDSLYTFALSATRRQMLARAIPPGFNDSISLYRELMTNGIAEDCEQRFIGLSHFLYRLLLADVLADSSHPEFDRLLLIPDGLLNFIAFETLLTKPVEQLNGAEGFLLEKYACSYAYAGTLVVAPPKASRPPSNVFAGFGLEYDDRTLQFIAENGYGKKESDTTLVLPCGLVDTSRYFGKLSFSDEEASDIATLLNGDAWLNENVTKSRFLRHAADYAVLHLAMHGSYDLTYPLNSALLFSREGENDVFLRAAEIYGLSLAAEMVVLSACNTAYGKLTAGEGPMSLARAFHYAGSPSVVASLWTLADYSASKIMLLFYEELRKGVPKDIALRNAKLAYLSDGDLSSPTTRLPSYWATAIVIGSNAPLNLGSGSRADKWYWWLLAPALLLLGWGWWRRQNRPLKTRSPSSPKAGWEREVEMVLKKARFQRSWEKQCFTSETVTATNGDQR